MATDVNEKIEKNENQEESKQTPENKRLDENKQSETTIQSENKQGEENSQDEKAKKQDKKDSPNYTMNQAIVGGVLGAGIGLLINPKMTKKFAKTIGESEFVKIASEEFKKTAQELLAGQAQTSIKQLTDGVLTKINDGILTPKKEDGDSTNSSGNNGLPEYEKIKEENKQLNERLEKIEKMLNALVDEK